MIETFSTSAAKPRLRFAPSPTGMFHVGGARTALFNWLYVQRNHGTFVLRIEDTDEERNREEWVQGIIDAMAWLGLSWDEGPLRQSDNKALHAQAAQRLVDDGKAYYCDCTREVVDARTKDSATPGYDKFCRDRGLGPGEGRALRFRVPVGETVVRDLIRGDVRFDNSTIEDFVVVRSTGVPMYMLANVVDDFSQSITHVVRGEEHLPNTPKQMLLWQALSDSPTPTYAHLPVIVNEKRQKLSKRRDKVALEMYRDEGFVAEAMRNYLALLGWSPKGDQEVVPLSQMIQQFDFADVQKSSAFFDVVKLTAINGDYIRALDTEEFIKRSLPFVHRGDDVLWPADNFAEEVFRSVAQMVQERVSRLDEVAPMIAFFFNGDFGYDDVAMKVMNKAESVEILRDVQSAYVHVEWSTEALHQLTQSIGEKHGLKLGKAQAPIRLAATGKKVGPPLFESLVVLGRDETIKRIDRLISTCGVGGSGSE